jgi:hypothetical protein
MRPDARRQKTALSWEPRPERVCQTARPVRHASHCSPRPAIGAPGVPRLGAFAITSATIHGALLVALARAPAPPPSADLAPALAGDTFDLSDLDDDRHPFDEATTGDSLAAPPRDAPAPPGLPSTGAPSAPVRRSPPEKGPVRVARPAAPLGGAVRAERSGGLPPAQYGAVSERGAVELTTAFTRGFPQAASADPVWTAVPFGDAGNAHVTLAIDEAGKLTGTALSPGGSPALRAGITRTLALIRGRAFVARAATTRLHVAARVAPDQVHDGLHGEVFALGGSFVGAEGNAFFALAIGRRIDIRIRVE